MEQREIRFRAKTVKDGDWVYGTPAINAAGAWMVVSVVNSGVVETFTFIPILPETVGQHTGLKDKNGKEIYEGDIVNCDDQNRVVKWSSQNAQFYMAHRRGLINFRMDFVECGQSQSDGPVHCDTCEVIGNIYQNPELIGG